MAEHPTETAHLLVSGSSSGFGRAVSEAVLDHGDHLVATAREQPLIFPEVQLQSDTLPK